MPDSTSATERIDAIVAALIERRDLARTAARERRESADRFDAEADELNVEVSDWNRIRALALDVALVPVGIPESVASAADRILEPEVTS